MGTSLLTWLETADPFVKAIVKTGTYNSMDVKGAPAFTALGNLNEQLAVLKLYSFKVERGEYFENPSGDQESCLEEVALMFNAQKCSFQNLLLQDDYEPTGKVMADHPGRIGMLTFYGTFLVLGNYAKEGRTIQMTRIHSPHLDYDGRRGHLKNDLLLNMKVGERPKLKIPGYGYTDLLKCSILRGLAKAPRLKDGLDADEDFEAKEIYRASTLMGRLFLTS